MSTRKRKGVRLPRVFQPKGQGNWVVRMRWQGRQLQRVAGTTERQAHKAAMRAYEMHIRGASLDEILQVVFGDPGGENYTFEDLAALYLDHALAAKTKKASTLRDIVTRLRRLRRHGWARKPARLLTTADASRWAAERARQVRPATVNRDLSCASSVFSFAVANGYVEGNPFSAVRRPSERGNARNLFLSPSQVNELLSEASEDLKPLLLCAVSTGLRRSELLLLTWDDIDLEAGTIRVRSENAKTARERRVPMTPELSLELRAIRSRQKVVRGPVFRTAAGMAMSPKALQRRWETTLGAWGDSPHGLRFHDLRHTAASLMINSGVDLYVVGQILGHSSAQTTRRYAHLILDRQREAVDALGASLHAERATG